MVTSVERQVVSSKIIRLVKSLLDYIRSQQVLLLQRGLILGLLVAAPLLGVAVARVDPFFVFAAVGAPLAVLGLHLIIGRFNLAPLIILFAGLFVPLALPTGTESVLVDSFLLTLLFVSNWILSMIIVDKRLRLAPSPVNISLLGFIIMVFISLIWSWVAKDPFVYVPGTFALVQTATAVTMVMLPAAFLLVANHVRDLRLLKAMVTMMLAAGVIAGAIKAGPFDIPLVNDRGLFTMWVVSLALGLALFNRELSWKWRAMALILALGWLYFRMGQQITWLAGWLSSFFVVMVLVFMRSKKLFLFVLILVVIYVSLNATYYLGTVIEDERDESGHTRVAAWEANWRVTGKHLLLGTGPAGYAAYYMSYFPSEGMATHNNYIDILAQTGIFGLLFSVWFFFTLAWIGYKLCMRLRGRGDFAEALANAALAGTLGCILMMGFGDWLFPFTYTQTIAGYDYVVYSWLFMGAIIVLDFLYPERKVDESANVGNNPGVNHTRI